MECDKWNIDFSLVFSMLEKIEGYRFSMLISHLIREFYKLLSTFIHCQRISLKCITIMVRKHNKELLTHNVIGKKFSLYNYLISLSLIKLQNLTLNYDNSMHFSWFYNYFVKINKFLLKFSPKIKFKSECKNILYIIILHFFTSLFCTFTSYP